MAEPLSPRGRQIVAAARELLEQEGPAALTMRRVADRLGIRAPSLYKHLPDKAALEAAIIATGFQDAAAAFEQAIDGAAEPLAGLAAAYRTFALAHPHLYRLMTDQPLPRDRLPAGLEDRTAAPLLHATGDPQLARAVFAFAHGMVLLELTRRLPAAADPQAAWDEGIAAFQARANTHATASLRLIQSTRRCSREPCFCAGQGHRVVTNDPDSCRNERTPGPWALRLLLGGLLLQPLARPR